MNRYEKRDIFTHQDYLDSCSKFNPEENKYIVETAGFVPLEVKMKQFEQNGIIAQFQQQDFTSHDLREIYLNPDFDITPEDDFEDIQDIIAARNDFINEIKSKKLESQAIEGKAGTQEPEKNPPAADKEEK